jgi:SAM-dependent methyltransferase
MLSTAQFCAAASSVINGLEREMRRVNARDRGAWNALELGCGTGQLLRPMSRYFSEIHGTDVSQGLLAEARTHLDGIANARLHLAMGSSLDDIETDSMDFVYSYAVLSNLANRNEAFENLLEVWRVLRPGCYARLHFNGLIQVRGSQYDSWDGIRFSVGDLLEFTARNGFQVFALEGAGTPDFWTTWFKREEDWAENVQLAEDQRVNIRHITNAFSQDAVVPSHGAFASLAISVEDLPPEAGLHHLRITVGGELGAVTYIGPRDAAGRQIIYADMPPTVAPGLRPVQFHWRRWPGEISQPISDTAPVRVIAPGPSVPRVISVADAANPSSLNLIETRRVRMTIEGAARLHELEVFLGGVPVEDLDRMMTDPRPQRYEVSFHVPDSVAPGLYKLQANLGQRRLAPVEIEILS